MEKDQKRFEECLNGLEGEVVAIMPHIKRTSLGQIYGVTRKIDFVWIILRTGDSLI